MGTHRLDRPRRERSDDPGAALARLADPARRVGVQVSPLDRSLEDRLQQRERLADGGVADSGRGQLGAQLANEFRRDRLKADVAKPGDDVDIEHRGIAVEGVALEVGSGVAAPPELGERRERLTAVGSECGAAEALAALELGVEHFGVGLTTDDARVWPALGVAPAHAPDGSVRALNLLDAHSSAPPSRWIIARNVPPGARRVARVTGGSAWRPLRRRLDAIQASKSCGVTRMRERSLMAGSSPESIARRTAFSDSWHAAAISRIESRCHSAEDSLRRTGCGVVARSPSAGPDVELVAMPALPPASSAISHIVANTLRVRNSGPLS